MADAATEQTPLLEGEPLSSARSALPSPKLRADTENEPPYSARSNCCEPMIGSKSLMEYIGLQRDEEVERVCQYETKSLGTWRAFWFTAGTVWRTRQIWEVARHLLYLSAFTAVLSFFTTVTPDSLDSSVFGVIANFLKVFVAFLLGYYITSSMSRWMQTIEGFLILFNSARNLMMQLHALGVSPKWIIQCSRYSILSAKFLSCELRFSTHDGEKEDADAEAPQSGEQLVERFLGEELLQKDEANTLRRVADHASLMWVWVALVLGRMAQDGEIPAMASPTYGRLMSLTQAAQEGIRKVYVSMMVQMPFVYVHMLAMLVHGNNIFCAISFGCTLGQCTASILARFDLRIWGTTPIVKGSKGTVDGSVQEDLQMIAMSLVTSLVAPLLYQAALQIGLALAQPFNTEVGSIPVERLIKCLKRDLEHAQIMADNAPGFEPPRFQKSKS